MAIVSRLVGPLAAFGTVMILARVFAQTAVPTVPGPLLGAGLPGLVVAECKGIWLTRKLRNRRTDLENH